MTTKKILKALAPTLVQAKDILLPNQAGRTVRRQQSAVKPVIMIVKTLIALSNLLFVIMVVLPIILAEYAPFVSLLPAVTA